METNSKSFLFWKCVNEALDLRIHFQQLLPFLFFFFPCSLHCKLSLHVSADPHSRLLISVSCKLIVFAWFTTLKALNAISGNMELVFSLHLLKNWSCASEFYSLKRMKAWLYSCCFLSSDKSTTCIKVTPARAELSYECWYAQWRLQQSVLEYMSLTMSVVGKKRVPCQNTAHPIFLCFSPHPGCDTF